MTTPTKRPSWATPTQHRLLCKFHGAFERVTPHSLERRLVWKGLYTEWQKTWTLDTVTKENLGNYFRTHRRRLPLDGREEHGQNDVKISEDEDSEDGSVNESIFTAQSTGVSSIVKAKTRLFPVRDANTIFVTIEMPGLCISDITVLTRGGDLCVSASSKTSLDDLDSCEGGAATETSANGAARMNRAAEWVVRERSSGKIQQRFTLAAGIHAGDIKASLEHGILILQYPLQDKQHRPISLKAISSN